MIRIINDLSFFAHTAQYFILDRILKISDMFVLVVGVRIFKAVKFGADVDLFNELRSHQQIHHHSTRYNNLITPQCHKSKSQCSLAYIFFFRSSLFHKNRDKKLLEEETIIRAAL